MATAARRTLLHHRATLNVSGSCNNLCDTAPDAAEFFARNRADNIWLQETIDKPLLDAKGRRLENFTRVETFGDNQANGNNDVNWLKVRVNARSREVFTYQPQLVPANRTAVPAP